MNFEELIDGLGKAIGMELTVQDGLCGVKADGVSVVMRYIESYAIVYIHADLGNPPPGGMEAIYKTANLTDEQIIDLVEQTIRANSDKFPLLNKYYR